MSQNPWRWLLTPGEWKQFVRDAETVHKPFLHLHRLFQQHPWWIYSFWLAFCILGCVQISDEIRDFDSPVTALVFFIGFGPIFYFFALRFGIWFWLWVSGFSGENLKIE